MTTLAPEVAAEVQKAEQLVARGEYDAGIALMQRVARASGSQPLMDRLIEMRMQDLERESAAPALHSMRESNDVLSDEQALRARLDEDGYLFLRGIVPVDRLLHLRDQITSILAEEGWIEGGERRLLAVASGRPCREGQPRFFRVHDRVVRLEALHALAHEDSLLRLMQTVLGATAFPHPLSIVRLIFPDSPELSTPPHQDYPNNQGSADLTAAWIPLADCAVEDGSLAVLEGSHRFGVLPLRFHLGAGNRRAVLHEELASLRWVGADFAAGDVLLFPSLTVHRALANHNASNMRLSVDYRYQREGEALTPGCLQPHFQRMDWDEIYRGWQSDKLKYYWREKQFVEVPWNPALHDLPPEHVDEAYEKELAFNLLFNRRRDL